MQTIIGSTLEKQNGAWRCMGIYFLSGTGGILFSCITSYCTNSLGASTAVSGLLTGLVYD